MGAGIDQGRRRFLRGRFARQVRSVPPPWSRDVTIRAACTGCGACIAACPHLIINFDGDGFPSVDLRTRECTFCGRCADACPEPVFDRVENPAFDHIAVIGDMCFAAAGIVCQTCGDSCPEVAIRFRLRIGGPALPELSADRCTGCGACIAACPAQAIGTIPRERERDDARTT